MKTYGPDKIHNVGVFGHGGSGKTTLVESLLYTTKATSRLGRVEDGTTVSDYDADEQKRRMSINLAVIPLEWKENKINSDRLPRIRRLCFRGRRDDARARWRGDRRGCCCRRRSGHGIGLQAARAANVPCLIYINKLDRDNADFDRTAAQVHDLLDAASVPMQFRWLSEVPSRASFRCDVSVLRLTSDKHDGDFTESRYSTAYAGCSVETASRCSDR